MGLFSEYPYQNFADYNLDWCINTVKAYTEIVDQLTAWKDQHEKEYAELKTLYDAVMRGELPEATIEAINNWLRVNALDIVGELVKMVFFGLTDSGYFVAYIPESWADIIFNTTGYDITVALMPEFGHLVLSY